MQEYTITGSIVLKFADGDKIEDRTLTSKDGTLECDGSTIYFVPSGKKKPTEASLTPVTFIGDSLGRTITPA